MDVTVERQRAIQLNGALFTEGVLIPAPGEEYFKYSKAVESVEEIFRDVYKLYHIGVNQPGEFTPVDTVDFQQELLELVKSVLIRNGRYSHKIERDDGSGMKRVDSTGDIRKTVVGAFPNESELDALPDMIRSPGVIVHITRMVLQTIFDSLSDGYTHMNEVHPFRVADHEWDEVQIT
jgi:hypothetical protein